MLRSALGFSALVLILQSASAAEPQFSPLFADDGLPKGWVVTEWNDLAKPVQGMHWSVKDGVLNSGKQRGNWLVSEKEYSDFILEFEFKLTQPGDPMSAYALSAGVMWMAFFLNLDPETPAEFRTQGPMLYLLELVLAVSLIGLVDTTIAWLRGKRTERVI